MKFVEWQSESSPGGMDWVPVGDGRVRNPLGDGEVSVVERSGSVCG